MDSESVKLIAVNLLVLHNKFWGRLAVKEDIIEVDRLSLGFKDTAHVCTTSPSRDRRVSSDEGEEEDLVEASTHRPDSAPGGGHRSDAESPAESTSVRGMSEGDDCMSESGEEK